MKTRFPLLPVLLIPVLTISPVTAQVQVGGSASDLTSQSSLQLQILQKDPDSVPVGTRSSKGILVEVSDANGVKVPNAAVVVRFPESGCSATFNDGTHAAVAYTDGTGRVQFSGLQWGNTPGSVAFRVTAAKGTFHAGLLLEETIAVASLPVANLPGSMPPAQPAAVAQQPIPVAERSAPTPAQPASNIAARNWRSAPSVTIEHAPSPGRPANALDEAPVSATRMPRQDTAAIDADSPDANVPFRHASGTGADAAEAPMVSITSGGQAQEGGHSKKKWLLILAAAAGAGAAMAMVEKGKTSTSTAASGISIGTPTVSVGHP